jgi:hypothetical protein
LPEFFSSKFIKILIFNDFKLLNLKPFNYLNMFVASLSAIRLSLTSMGSLASTFGYTSALASALGSLYAGTIGS